MIFILSILFLILFIGKDFFFISIGEDFLQFLPNYYFAFKSLFSGILPFWSPYKSLGMPELFVSDFSYFYPGVWIVAIINFLFNRSLDFDFLGKSFQLYQYFHLFLAQIGMYLLLRKGFSLNKITAFFGSIIYGYSPLNTWDLTVITALSGKALFPFIIYFQIEFIQKNSKRSYLSLIILNYLIFSTGYPYHYIYFTFAEFALIILSKINSFKRFLIIIFISFLLSSYFLLPNFFIIKKALNNPFFPKKEFTQIDNKVDAFASPTRITNLFNFKIFSRMYNSSDPNLLYSAGSIFFGVISLIFFFYGISNLKKSPYHVWLILIFVLGIAYGLGKYLNIPGLLELFPLLNTLRSISRILILPFFTATIVISLGADSLFKGYKNVHLERYLLLFFMISFLALVFFPLYCNSCLLTKGPIIVNFAKSIILFGLGLLLVYLLRTQRNPVYFYLIILLTFAELTYHYKSDYRQVARRPITYKQYLQKNSLIPEMPSKDNLFRIHFESSQFAYNTSHLGISSLFSLASIPNMVPRDLWARLGSEKAMQYANVKYYVTVSKLNSEQFPNTEFVASIDPAVSRDETFISQVKDLPFWSEKSADVHNIYKIKNYLPRFFVPENAFICSTSPQCFKMENPPQNVFALKLPHEFKKQKSDNVAISILEFNPNSIVISSTSPNETFVSSSEIWDQGWELRINGEKSQIYNVSDGFKGYIIPKGKSTIIFTYIPYGLPIGIILSVVGIIGLRLSYKKFYEKA